MINSFDSKEMVNPLWIDIQPPGLFNILQSLIRMAFPNRELREGGNNKAGDYIAITASKQNEQVVFGGEICINGKVNYKEERHPLTPDRIVFNDSIKNWARKFIYRLLCIHLDRNFNRYGILTGVRPVKIAHRLLDEGWDVEHIKDVLEKQYLVTPAQAKLLMDVANANHSFLLSAVDARKLVSVYIGIPFCPSRCYYCSFPGTLFSDYMRDVCPFIDALIKEMNAIGDYIISNGLKVQTVYLGGGTPTVLSEKEFARIFDILHRKYISPATIEVTVEAGRPDTI